LIYELHFSNDASSGVADRSCEADRRVDEGSGLQECDGSN